MKVVATIAIYGDFKQKDIKMKVFTDSGTSKYVFQNILHEAGYDCKLFSVHDEDMNQEK